MDNMFKSMNENLDKLLLAQSSQQHVFVVRRSQFQDQQDGYQQNLYEDGYQQNLYEEGYQQQQWGTPHGFDQQQSQAPQFQEPDMQYMQSSYDPYADHYGDDLQSGSWGSSGGFPQPTHYAEHDYHPHGFSTPEPYAGYIGDDLENGSWEWSDGFHQPTPYAQQVYYPPDFSTPGPSHAPPPQDTDMMSMLQQILQGQAANALMINSYDFSTTAPRHVPPTQDNELMSTLPMHQDMDPTECYNEWSAVDNTTQAKQEYAYDAIEYALELDFAVATTSQEVQDTTLTVNIDELSEGEELIFSEMPVVNNENESGLEEHSQLPYGPSVERLETEKTFQDGKLNDKKEEASKSVEREEQHPTLNVDIDELSEGDELKLSEMRVINKEKREPLFQKIEYTSVPLPDEPHFTFAGVISAIEVSLEDPMKPTFEEIRMNEFRGWFYDEYDPGDPNQLQELLTCVLTITLEGVPPLTPH